MNKIKIAKFFSAGMLPTIGFFLFTLGLSNLPKKCEQKIPSSLFDIRGISCQDISSLLLIPIFVGILLILGVLGQYYDTKKSIEKALINEDNFPQAIKLNLSLNSQKMLTIFWTVLYFNLAVLFIKYFDTKNQFSVQYTEFIFYIGMIYLAFSIANFLSLSMWDKVIKDNTDEKTMINKTYCLYERYTVILFIITIFIYFISNEQLKKLI